MNDDETMPSRRHLMEIFPPAPIDLFQGKLFTSAPDSFASWFCLGGTLHPNGMGTIRCFARVDAPNEPSFSVEDGHVYTVPGRYCMKMHRCNDHEGPESGAPWEREFIGTLHEIRT